MTARALRDALAELFATRAGLAAQLRDVDSRIECVLLELAARDTTTCASEAVVTARNPPPGVSRRAFNDRCRKLARSGDPRVRKIARVWSAPIAALLDERRRGPEGLTELGSWTPSAAISRAGGRTPQAAVRDRRRRS